MSALTGEVTFTFEQVPETHRTLEADHTVTEQELPGVVNVYANIGGGKLLFTQFNGGKVIDAIQAAKQAQAQASSQAQPQSSSQEQPTQNPQVPAENQPPAQPDQV